MDPESTQPVHSHARGRSWTGAAATVLLVAGGVAYADWVLQLFLPVHAALTTSFISELSATGQPHHDLFRLADVVGGALLVAGGAAAWLATRRWGPTWTALVLLGACIVLEASLPLDDTFTFAAVMPRTGTLLWWERVSEPHGVVSFVETLSFLFLFLSCTRALRQTSATARWRGVVAVVGLLAVLCGVADAVLTAALLMGGHAAGLGLVQRIGVTLTAAWLAAAPSRLVAVGAGRAGIAERDRTAQLTMAR